MKPKKIFFPAAALLVCIPSFAEVAPAPAAAPTEIAAEKKSCDATETKISGVIVFADGARVTRTAQVNLRAGEQEIVLGNFSREPKNFSVETNIPGARVVSAECIFLADGIVSVSDDALRELDRATAREASLRARIDEASAAFQKLLLPESFFAEKKGEPLPPFSIDVALDTLAFQQSEAARLTDEILRLKDALAVAEIEREIAAEKCRKNHARKAQKYFLRVKIFAENAASGTVSATSEIRGASWSPSYDLHVAPDASSVAISSYGFVYQNTGEDWNDVPVTLSTARVFSPTELPSFEKILITENFYEPEARPLAARATKAHSSAAADRSEPDGGGFGMGFGPGIGGAKFSLGTFRRERSSPRVLDDSRAGTITFSDGHSVDDASNIRYLKNNYIFRSGGVLTVVPAADVLSISKNYEDANSGDFVFPGDFPESDFRCELTRGEKIRGDGMPVRCPITTENFSGDFYYRIVPASSENAYRMLRVTNGKIRPLLAGPASIFYGENFIGKMNLPFTVRGAAMEIPLGEDSRVAVERRRINAIGDAGTFSSGRRNDVSVSTKIKNRTSGTIRVECVEAIPVSAQNEIEISEPTFSPAARAFEKSTGVAEWSVPVAAGAEIELRADYKISYPENFALEENSVR